VTQRIEFRVLGPVEVIADERPVALGGPRQRTLLAMLLLRIRRVVPTDELLDAIWAGDPPEGAATTIRSYVSRLRSALAGFATISGTAWGYAIHVDADLVDAALFDRLVRDADAGLARGEARAASDQLARALSMWRGRAFGDLGDDGALRIEAERLDQLRLHAVEQRYEAELRVGNAAQIVDALESSVATYPFRERLWRQLMLALYQSGRQADALATYHRARRMLDEQLGIEPTPELRALENAILRHELTVVAGAEPRERGIRR
jgi:DNA-binding SARP family transcriptional activator